MTSSKNFKSNEYDAKPKFHCLGPSTYSSIMLSNNYFRAAFILVRSMIFLMAPSLWISVAAIDEGITCVLKYDNLIPKLINLNELGVFLDDSSKFNLPYNIPCFPNLDPLYQIIVLIFIIFRKYDSNLHLC